MLPLTSELTWLDARQALSLSDLSCVCALSVEDLVELVDYGALVPLVPLAPVAPDPRARQFSAQCVTQLRAACQLRVDYDLDLFSVAMLIGYLTRIESLEREVGRLQAHQPHHRPGPLEQPR